MGLDHIQTVEKLAKTVRAPSQYNLVQKLHNTRTGIANYRTGHHRMGNARTR